MLLMHARALWLEQQCGAQGGVWGHFALLVPVTVARDKRAVNAPQKLLIALHSEDPDILAPHSLLARSCPSAHVHLALLWDSNDFIHNQQKRRQ